MNYQELIFTITSNEDYHRDILIDALAGIGFDTFEETETGFKAYIPASTFDEAQLENALLPWKGSINFFIETNFVQQKNWNEVWESNFEPLQIGNSCYVRATFHKPAPSYKYEIVIDPKMAFGTGHHQTTSMVMEMMLDEDFREKQVLDMGCGTGILAILASMLGAKDILAIDYDQVCVDSTVENSALNEISNISAVCGSKEAIPDEKFDFILANINRNILLEQMSAYVKALKPSGKLLMSGFYEEPDLKIIKEAASGLNLQFVEHRTKQSWVAAKFSF